MVDSGNTSNKKSILNTKERETERFDLTMALWTNQNDSFFIDLLTENKQRSKKSFSLTPLPFLSLSLFLPNNNEVPIDSWTSQGLLL